jgi:hypothetical protein
MDRKKWPLHPISVQFTSVTLDGRGRREEEEEEILFAEDHSHTSITV